jgi:hypothetical protein
MMVSVFMMGVFILVTRVIFMMFFFRKGRWSFGCGYGAVFAVSKSDLSRLVVPQAVNICQKWFYMGLLVCLIEIVLVLVFS